MKEFSDTFFNEEYITHIDSKIFDFCIRMCYHCYMVITIDTNVIFSALYSNKGASFKILDMVLNEKIKLAISAQTYFEYYDVLMREKNRDVLNLTIEEIEDFLDLLAMLAQKQNIYFLLRPNLKDEKDNIFVECAFASNSSYLVTSNIKDFKQNQLKNLNFEVITPNKFFKNLETKNE